MSSLLCKDSVSAIRSSLSALVCGEHQSLCQGFVWPPWIFTNSRSGNKQRAVVELVPLSCWPDSNLLSARVQLITASCLTHRGRVPNEVALDGCLIIETSASFKSLWACTSLFRSRWEHVFNRTFVWFVKFISKQWSASHKALTQYPPTLVSFRSVCCQRQDNELPQQQRAQHGALLPRRIA